MSRECYLCGRANGPGKRELRPYGPQGKDICAGCMFGEDGKAPDPKVQAEVGARFGEIINSPEPLMITNHGVVKLPKPGQA